MNRWSDVVVLLTVCTCLNGCTDDQLIGGNANTDGNIISSDSLVISEHPIINGTLDNRAEHNAVVSLMDSSGHSFCTGTLIHPKYVLTAAHCMVKKTSLGYEPLFPKFLGSYLFTIGVGDNVTDINKNRTKYNVSKFWFHENYVSQEKVNLYYTITANDIALIQLSDPVPEAVAKPIRVLPPWFGVTDKRVTDGIPVEFVGFGITEKGESGLKMSLRDTVADYCSINADTDYPGCELDDPVVITGCHPDPTICQKSGYERYCKDGKLCVSKLKYYAMIPKGGLYFKKTEDQAGVCNGDSGGPALTRIGGQLYVVGITSVGDSYCAAFSMSTSVSDFYDWIVDKAPAVRSMYSEICDNGVDDDDNGYKDGDDVSCKEDF